MAGSEERASIGSYEVDALLGVGHFSEVYRVRGTDGQVLALKWFFAGESRDLQEGLRSERDVLGALNHPRIPALTGEGEAEGRPYLLMQYARGRSLLEIAKERAVEGGMVGAWHVVRAVKLIAETLEYMHGGKDRWVHRDLKPANIIARNGMAELMLVDFGFARRVGDSQARTSAQFWEGGAALFSPPEKLLDPNDTDVSQDIFALGVIAFYLLTTRFPWHYPRGGDRERLRKSMLRDRPPTVHQLNSLVPVTVSRLVQQMLQIEADKRLSATRVVELAGDLLADAEAAALEGSTVPVAEVPWLRLPRVVRDPLHGDIRLTEHEWSVINTPEIQRLRWMRQLGLTSLVYPGADHSRFSHVMGTLHVTERILTSIEQIQGIRIDADLRLTARLYALVHDVGHIAFGHTIEDELGYFDRHDENEPRLGRLLHSNRSALGQLLSETEYGRNVIALLDPHATTVSRSEVAEIVGGSTGADVLDYIDRDSLFCGLDQRIDSALFRQFRLDFPDPALGGRLLSQLHGSRYFRLDRAFAIESVLLQRYALFLKVYTHPLKLSAAAMLDKALFELLVKPKQPTMVESEIERMSDGEFLGLMKFSKKRLVSQLATAISQRRLFRPAYWAEILPRDSRNDSDYAIRLEDLRLRGLITPTGRREAEVEITRSLKARGISKDDVAVYCPPTAPGHQRIRPRVIDSLGHIDEEEMAEPYKTMRALHVGIWGLHVFTRYPKDSFEWKAIQENAEDYFKLPNLVFSDRRQQRFPV